MENEDENGRTHTHKIDFSEVRLCDVSGDNKNIVKDETWPSLLIDEYHEDRRFQKSMARAEQKIRATKAGAALYQSADEKISSRKAAQEVIGASDMPYIKNWRWINRVLEDVYRASGDDMLMSNSDDWKAPSVTSYITENLKRDLDLESGSHLSNKLLKRYCIAMAIDEWVEKYLVVSWELDD